MSETTILTASDLPSIRAQLEAYKSAEASSADLYPIHAGDIARLTLAVPLLEAGIRVERTHDGFNLNDRIIVAVHKQKYVRLWNGKRKGTWERYYKTGFIIAVAKSERDDPAVHDPDGPRNPPQAPTNIVAMRPAKGRDLPPYKSVLSKIDDATHRQIKRIAADENAFVGDLQIEALNLLFRSRGLPEIAVRVSPEEKTA